MGGTRAVALLALGSFAMGTDAYAMAGLLPAIGADLHVSVSLAGQSVTAFTLCYALAAPLFSAVLARWGTRTVLVTALVVFVLANAGTALTGSYAGLLGTRALAGAAAGLFTPAAATAAVALVPPERRGRALGLVLGGMSAGTVLGVPLGLLVAAAHGWRAALWLITALGVAALLGVAGALPRSGSCRALAAGQVRRPRPAPGGRGRRRHLHPDRRRPRAVHLSGAGPAPRRRHRERGAVPVGLGHRRRLRQPPRRHPRRPDGQARPARRRPARHPRRRPGPAAVGRRRTRTRPAAPRGLGRGRLGLRRAAAAPAPRPGRPGGAAAVGLNSSATYLGGAVGSALGGLALAHGLDAGRLPLLAAGVACAGVLLHLTAVPALARREARTGRPTTEHAHGAGAADATAAGAPERNAP